MSADERMISRRRLLGLLTASTAIASVPAWAGKARRLSLTQPQAQNPLATASHLWDMSADVARHFAINGAVKLGVPLEGIDRLASLARGGNGEAAKFEGGYLELINDAELALNPKQWTIAVRMRDQQGLWRYPILGSYGNDRTVSVALRAVDIASKPMADRSLSGRPVPTVESWLVTPNGPRSVPGTTMLEAVWGAKEPDFARQKLIRDLQPPEIRPNPLDLDVHNAAMRVNYPVGLIGPLDWHDVVLTMTGAKLQLWIDGVLVDEEFPIGETRSLSIPFMIGAALEDGALKTGLHGWIDHVAIWNRPLSLEEIATLSGGRDHVRQRELAILGDESPSMQYFRARGHNRKAGDCIPYWDERTATFRLFYLILRRNQHSKWDGGHGGLEIWQASTQDLKFWTHHPVTIPITEQWEAWIGTGAVAFHNGQYNWFYPSPYYGSPVERRIHRAVSKDGVNFTKIGPDPVMPGGDLEIFQDESGLFNLIKAEDAYKQVRLTSADLETWVEQSETFIASDKQLNICPNVFSFGEWFYYLCGSGVWKGRSWFGPWEEHRPLLLDNLSVPKTAAFGKNRRIYAGFVVDDGWGGNLLLRELVQAADGTLGTCFVKELVPATRKHMKVRDVVRVEANGKRIVLSDIPSDYRLRMEIVPESGVTSFGIGLKSDEAGVGDLCELTFLPLEGRASFGKIRGSSGKTVDGPSIDSVTGIGKPFILDIIVRHDLIDAEIAGFHTLITRFWNPASRNIAFFAKGGAVTFQNIRISPLLDTYKPYPGWAQPN